ncbi:MAG TPA: DCC1-like thiol-disulfide oxidoreductase family protein [Allosphingosinicella sp.]|jgi:predicted DCC family thiol-disulfide oxidoreductase YuxK
MDPGPYSWRADPRVPAFPDEHPLIVFDGECVMCSANARFVLRRDRRRRFRLTTAQGPLGAALYRHFGLRGDEEGTILVLEGGRLFTETDAAIAIALGLGWPWRWAAAARILPRYLRDPVYRWVARNRFRWFGRRETCWVPDPADRGRIV